ncbi:hypothetical protein CTAYLR_002197 [Chrysophaeum taylorii]|uniref:DUF3127 domain-containing protein n=1 Tax=Chrysophaeum taylorii TaxID=2483200 RepID=A0AAD7UN71_9STRA|nr:hypothetical protein CTAYLR_002197 [Chrysophaeum taylorii]
MLALFCFRRTSGFVARQALTRITPSRAMAATGGSLSFDMAGKLKVIGDIQKFESGFFKRDIVLTTDELYPQDIKFDLLKEKADIISDFFVGDEVTVSFNIRGRKWDDRHFVNLVAWRIQHTKRPDWLKRGNEPSFLEASLEGEEGKVDQEEDDGPLPFPNPLDEGPSRAEQQPAPTTLPF